MLTSLTLEGMTWATFEHLFFDKYCLDHVRNLKRVEFLFLQQRDLSIVDFEVYFGDLAQFVPDIKSNNTTKARTFECRLKPGFRGTVMHFKLPTCNQVVQKARVFEVEYLVQGSPSFGKKIWII